ncbi:MAG: hypothetical protein V1747_06680 [Candidatus Omnitrophota bacterium]
MTTIFHNAQINKEKLRQIILKNPQSLLAGLSFIDLEMATDESGVIDFLGVDITGRMVVVNFDTQANDQMLIEILSQIQWLKKNEGLIKRLFFSESVDFEQAPQMLLVCPVFSNKIQSAVKQLTDKDIKLLKFKYIVSNADDAIIFDEVFSSINSASAPALKTQLSTDRESIMVDRAALTKHAPLIKKTVSEISEDAKKEQSPLYDVITLTPEEITEFMDFNIALAQSQAAD